MRPPPRDTIPARSGLAFGKQTATSPQDFGINESDGAPDEKESRPKHQTPGYQACIKARSNVASASERQFAALTQAHRAVPS